MAKFRYIHTEFWNNTSVAKKMTTEEKYFFLYLLTNHNTTQTGIYEITKKRMAFDTGYSLEDINVLLDCLMNHHQIILFNPETREVAIKNWGEYNFIRCGKRMMDCIKFELKRVKDASLISFVGACIENDRIKKLYDAYTTCEENAKLADQTPVH